MNRISYFLEKFLDFVMAVHPLTYLFLLILTGILFFISRQIINKIFPYSNKKSLFAITLTLGVGLPTMGLFIYILIGILLKDQPF
jgi:hypothetical protein